MHVASSVRAEIARQPETAPVNGCDPGNVAYVIYTSGSTGRPKGVMNAHRGIVNRIAWMQDAYCLTPDDRVMQKTPFGRRIRWISRVSGARSGSFT